MLEENQIISPGATNQGEKAENSAIRRREEDTEEIDNYPNRWEKLWLPEYEEGAIDFDDKNHCKRLLISESDVEKDDDAPIPF